MFSANQTETCDRKDTVVNAEREGEFVWNLATWATREAVNISSEQVPYGEDEFSMCDSHIVLWLFLNRIELWWVVMFKIHWRNYLLTTTPIFQIYSPMSQENRY